MYNVKKLLSLILMLSITILIVACNNTTEMIDDQSYDDDNNLIVVGFSQPGAESAWRVALTDSVKEAFTEEKGYKLIYKDGQSKQDNQIRDIRTFIQQGVDYIILSPIVETGWDTVLEEAKEADIPVIICDRDVMVSNEALYTAFVGSNFAAEGKKAITYMENKYKPDAEGNLPRVNIVHIQGTMGSSAQIGRSKALEKGLEEHENWKVVAEGSGDFTKAKAKEIMKNALQQVHSSEIDVIYCENDEEALGAIAALDEAGIPHGDGTGITIISFDATTSALKLCMEGKISLVVECNPLQGNYLYNMISLLEEGEAAPKLTYVDEGQFTKDDLTEEFIDERKY
ncbi:MAG: ABC transporter substrate-binding protein [Pseudobutyrivibrio sp.]|nr:ABC transporter substrate-binding protein [Pseudobutyrivibrio sp.]